MNSKTQHSCQNCDHFLVCKNKDLIDDGCTMLINRKALELIHHIVGEHCEYYKKHKTEIMTSARKGTKGLKYDMLIPCPECQYGTLDILNDKELVKLKGSQGEAISGQILGCDECKYFIDESSLDRDKI